MPQEIERKFLLKNKDWKALASKSYALKQGYLSTHPERSVRIRIKGEKGILTIKGKTEGIARAEYEYEIPVQEAEELLLLCEKPIIEKTRYEVLLGVHRWEIDVFEGVNKGLCVAEIELASENEAFDMPTWIAEEVSDDTRYFNASLVKHPYSNWSHEV